jgi:SAM-dependent methyltransferase
MSRPFLDFYGQNNIAPVRQDISDLDLHLKRRAALYTLLHIPPNAVRGRRVLEVGPGSGDNAIYTASLNPASYTLMDANPRSLAEVEAKLADRQFAISRLVEVEVIESDFLEYRGAEKFDLVICEGTIPGQLEPEAFTCKLASLVDEGGMLVVTTSGATGILSDVCRRLIKPILASQLSRDELLPGLCKFFDPHLSSLPGRSRLTEDWVWDNILHPWPDALPFSASRAVKSVVDELTFFGSSPMVVQDFRWYKSIALGRAINAVALEQIEKWAPFFIDYRIDENTRFTVDGSVLEDRCHDFYMLAQRAWETGNIEKVDECVSDVLGIAEVLWELPMTAKAIRDFASGARRMLKGEDADFGTFPPWFGRGMQYLSFVRL